MFFERFMARRSSAGERRFPARADVPNSALMASGKKFDVNRALSNYNARRVKQMIVAINLLAVLSVANNLVFDRGLWLTAAAILVFCVMFVARRFYESSRPEAAQFLFLWTIFIAVTYITWQGDGLRDQIILGNSIALVFSAILSTPRHFFVMYAAVLLNALALGVANANGWVDFSAFAFDWSNVGDAVMLYSVTAVTVFILANDMRHLLSRYNVEYQKAKASEDEIFRLANHDTLTGLPNLFMAEKKYRDEIGMGPTPEICLFMIGLDNFKAINDSLGHVFVDDVLKMIAKRLDETLGKGGCLFRMSGDVFGYMTAEATNAEEAQALAEKLQKRVAEPLESGREFFLLTCCVGASIGCQAEKNFEQLRREADIAMYRAKSIAPNTFTLFDETMSNQALELISMAAKLQTALDKNEFEVYLQPKFNLRNGSVAGAEALLRWFPDGGAPVRPDIFIPIAENTGMIVEIGEWVLRESCREAKRIQGLGHPDFAVAVNVSAVQFKRGNLEAAVEAALSASGLEPHYLELELTESLLLEDEYDIAGQISRLAERGISFSVDDFGKGYSNLGNLSRFEIKTLKIDQAFVFRMLESDKNKALVEAIVGLAKSLKLKTVAEGVETQAAADHLRAIGADCGQGYLWSKPLPIPEFIDLLDVLAHKSAAKKAD